MAKKTKLWPFVATCLVLLGCIILGSVMMGLNWDFTKLSTSKYETNNHTISEPFENISIVSDTARIEFIPSQNSQTTIVCYEQINLTHTVTVQDNTLTIRLRDQRKWYDYIGINFTTPKITVYIPQGQYGELIVGSSTGNILIAKEFQFKSIDIYLSTGKVTSHASVLDEIRIKTTIGDISLENISAGKISLSATTGKTTLTSITCSDSIDLNITTGKSSLTDVKCKKLTSVGSTGNIVLNNVIADGTLSVSRSTGDIALNSCDAADLWLYANTGNITGSLRSSKVFIAKTSTGRISIPGTSTGGNCSVTTSTGNISFTID